MLIVELPSTLHEAAVYSLTSIFQRASHELDANNYRLWKRWSILGGKENPYGDLASKGVFTADAAFEIKNLSVLLFEVGFSQGWEDLFSKANRLLNSSESVLGVIVMNIKEDPRWTKPNRRSKPDDFIGDQEKWDGIIEECQKEKPFGPIIVGGHVWMQKIKVDLCLLTKPQEANPS
jgi:hypothetical protein